MIMFRFKVSSKTEMASQPGMLHLQFSAGKQEPFGNATPNVQFAMSLVKATGDQFVVGAEYDFTIAATPVPADAAVES